VYFRIVGLTDGPEFRLELRSNLLCLVELHGAPNASGLADNANSEGGTNNVMMAIGTSGTVPLVVGNTAW